MGMMGKELTNLLPLCCLPSMSVICTFLWCEWRVLSFNIVCVCGVCVVCAWCVCVCVFVWYVCVCVWYVCVCENFPECWQTDYIFFLKNEKR